MPRSKSAPPLLTVKQPNITELSTSFKFWGIVVITGATSGLAGGLLMKLLRVTQHFCYSYSRGDFLSGVQRVSGTHRIFVMFLAGVVAAAALSAMRRFRLSSGESLSLAVWNSHGKMLASPKLIRAFLSIVVVGMGAPLGREGALKDTGGVLANKFSDWFEISPAQRQLLVACGAGAGMAAAYNVPLGGALFAAGVLLGSLALSTLLPALAASFTGVAVSWLLLPNEAAYIVPAMHLSRSLVWWAIPAGPLLGLLAAGWVRLIEWTRKQRWSESLPFLLPVAVFTAVGLVAVRFPQILGNGKNIVQLTFYDQLGAGLLCWLIVLKPLATVLCLGTGTPGGLFTPTMTLGALIGDGLGRIWNCFGAGNQVACYALVGSAAFLAAATLGPLSSAVFLLELTRGAEPLMVPLLIAATGATITARRFGEQSIYTD